MILTSTEYTFDGSKVLFYFTADNRVDFRELVKILASVLHTRIELRQIGVRDKAKMVGGLGICGRPFCCGEFLEDFQPVSIKMAKTQNLSLNPTKISGTCGRLMCCLNYEQEAYEDLLRTSPKADSFVDTPDGRGTVTNVNLLRQSVNVRLEKQPDTIVCHKNCDICVLRNGKAKKTDEPIPEDLAPISGGKPKAEPESNFATYLEPVLLRKQEDVSDQESDGRSRRRRRGNKPPRPEQAETEPKQEKPEKSEKKEKKSEQKTEKKGKKAENKAEKKQEAKSGKKPEAGSEKKQEPKPEKRQDKKSRHPKAEPKEKLPAEAPAPGAGGGFEPKEGAGRKPHRRHRYHKNHKSSKKPENG